MPRRVSGDPAVEPWPGSAEERAASRARAEREREAREHVAAALRTADFAAAEAVYEPTAVRRLAKLNAESMADVGVLANRLNAEGRNPSAGQQWNGFLVSHCIGLLWPRERYRQWPTAGSTYPGYLGGLRDELTITMPFSVLGPRRHQYHCTRCGALWPPGWPDTDHRDHERAHCPDCRSPGFSVGGVEQEREHSIIDLHWLMFRFAPRPVGPCPACGGPRELIAQGYFDVNERVLYWSCEQADELGTRGQPDSHYRKSLVKAEWESLAAHYAYWLAVDMLRLAKRTGELTELPIGAEYEALDGGGERWSYLATGWQRTDTSNA